jgi:hypothetical protein
MQQGFDIKPNERYTFCVGCFLQKVTFASLSFWLSNCVIALR